MRKCFPIPGGGRENVRQRTLSDFCWKTGSYSTILGGLTNPPLLNAIYNMFSSSTETAFSTAKRRFLHGEDSILNEVGRFVLRAFFERAEEEERVFIYRQSIIPCQKKKHDSCVVTFTKYHYVVY